MHSPINHCPIQTLSHYHTLAKVHKALNPSYTLAGTHLHNPPPLFSKSCSHKPTLSTSVIVNGFLLVCHFCWSEAVSCELKFILLLLEAKKAFLSLSKDLVHLSSLKEEGEKEHPFCTGLVSTEFSPLPPTNSDMHLESKKQRTKIKEPNWYISISQLKAFSIYHFNKWLKADYSEFWWN